MSCLSALSSQIFTFVSELHEVLLLQHQVLQEYVKVALGRDFSHTFPSLIIIATVCIMLRRYLRVKWWPITSVKSFFFEFIKLVVSWIAINGVLWYWLILQRVLYCTVWTYWTNDPDIRDIYSPWWQKVWSSFHPPTTPPPVLSASLISWILTMMLANIGLLSVIYADYISACFCRAVFNITENMDEITICRESIVKRESEIMTKQVQGEIEGMEISEVGSFCDECRSEVSTDFNHRNITQREISPICYGTNWIKSNCSDRKIKREISNKTLAGVAECLMTDDNYLPRQMHHQRSCHSVIPSSSSEILDGC